MPNAVEPFRPELGTVQETLLLPLYLRARETARDDAIIRDPRAVEIVDQIDYEFSRLDSAWRIQLDVILRTKILDEQVERFLQQHPNAIVVNLGVGLDTRFQRLDNGSVAWFDLDMPDSIELRRRFFQESERNLFLTKSMFDYSWIDDIQRKENQPVLILAEGLLMYFREEQVRELFTAIADRLPGAEIIFQSISPLWVNQGHTVPGVRETGADFHWGIKSARQVEKWDSRFELLDEWAFIDRREYRHRWRWVRYFLWFPPVYIIAARALKLSHLRFNPAEGEIE